ncbi:MAG: hypothetical protein GX424_05965 [Clostridiales bacterium]|jgi:hypothetical protein|nr:hypothetical protein [Clostridiales bacterium]
MDFWDYLIIAAVILLAGFAIRYSLRHKGSCCGDCTRCRGCGNDDQKKKK